MTELFSRQGSSAARYSRPVRRGGSISSSSRTCSACATLISTASVGLAPPDSRFAQVARGMPAMRAICCWVRPRASRKVWMLRPRCRAVLAAVPPFCASAAIANNMAA